MLSLGLAALLFALPPASLEVGEAAPAQEEDCLGEDDTGAHFPICFDPGNALLLGTGLQVRDGRALPTLQAGILLRTERTSRSKGMLWFNTHRFLVTEATPGAARQALTATLYSGAFRRHLEEGFILIPTSRPIRIPFPFDVTFDMRVGHLERRVWEGPGLTVETGRAALLLDPIRSVSGRLWLGLGPAASHAFRRLPDGVLEQEISPFTSAVLDTGYETEDGWWTLRASGLAGWVSGFEGGRRFRARADASVERILFAVNGQPLWLQLYGGWVHQDAGLARRTEWTSGARLLVRSFSAL
ncbi:hypothetical protein POL68_14150 [Stigmatella sp. ncwal1]|uniref:Uncharacterized protein n=1 Tax=Stigmatella ashevillensis TaxID=2995309 RepID=A0ABT5D7I2_9BACT|nr:hypothetical protein [Stigmatella ashevillena]MDC0709609.1 hypothetical protein [Stigmatella ashevillena]